MRAGATLLHERRCRGELTLFGRMHRIARTVEIVIPGALRRSFPRNRRYALAFGQA
jgi:hypothetical protein